MSIRDRINYIDKKELSLLDPALDPGHFPEFFAFTYNDKPPEGKEGIVEMINKTDEFKRKFRSCYVRWALTINALNVSDKYYSEHPDRGLGVGFLRITNDKLNMRNLIELDAMQAKENTMKCLEVIAAYGVFDLYGCFEEIIFDIYEIYWNFYPEKLMVGKDYKKERSIFKNRNESEEKRLTWDKILKERIKKWRRKRGYDKISNVFTALIKDIELEYNEHFVKHFSSMVTMINAISELRNIITHGGDVVTETLGKLCREGENCMFPYKTGEKIAVNLFTLASVEYFFDSVITDINRELMVSLVENKDAKMHRV